MGDELHNRIENDFVYHPVKPGQEERYVHLRDEARKLAHLIHDLSPDGREKMIALGKLEEAIMWANAGIARNE